MRSEQPSKSSKFRVDEPVEDISALFTLHVDETTQLATVRPRLGSLLLVESMSASQIVLRLQPPTNHSISTPPMTPPLVICAVSESSSTPDREILPGKIQADGERVRSTITKEQLSAAQMAVQRSLRGLTGADITSSRSRDADIACGREIRSFKRASAPVASWSHERRVALGYPSGSRDSSQEHPCPPSSVMSWSSGRSSPTESTLVITPHEGGAPHQVKPQSRRIRAPTTGDCDEDRSSGGQQDVYRVGGREASRARRRMAAPQGFSDGGNIEPGVSIRRGSSNHFGRHSENAHGVQLSHIRPHHQPVPPLPPARLPGGGSANISRRSAQQGALLHQQATGPGASGNGDSIAEQNLAAARAPHYGQQAQPVSGRQSPPRTRTRPSSRHVSLPPSVVDLVRSGRGSQLVDPDHVATKSPKVTAHEPYLHAEMLARATPVSHGVKFWSDEYSGRPSPGVGGANKGGRRSVPPDDIAIGAAAAAASYDRTPSAPALCTQSGVPEVTDDATAAITQWSSLRVSPPRIPFRSDVAATEALEEVERSHRQELLLRPEESETVRQIAKDMMEGYQSQGSTALDTFRPQNTYTQGLPHQQQTAHHTMGNDSNQAALLAGDLSNTWARSAAQASFYPLPAGSDQSARLSNIAIFDGGAPAHEAVHFAPPAPALQGGLRTHSKAPSALHLAAPYASSAAHQSYQPYHLGRQQQLQQQQFDITSRPGSIIRETMLPSGKFAELPSQSSRHQLEAQHLGVLPWAPPGIRRASEPAFTPDGASLQLGSRNGGVSADLFGRLGERAFSAETTTSDGQGERLSVLHHPSLLGDWTHDSCTTAPYSAAGPGDLPNLRSLRAPAAFNSSDTRGNHHVNTHGGQPSLSVDTSESFDSQIPSPYPLPASMFAFLDGDDS